jgi:hypothetical protein
VLPRNSGSEGRRLRPAPFLLYVPSQGSSPRGVRFLAKSKPYGGKSAHFVVELEGGNLVVSLPNGRFKATPMTTAWKAAREAPLSFLNAIEVAPGFLHVTSSSWCPFFRVYAAL